MSALNEHQFEILPDAEATDGFVFGIGADVSVENFDSGERSWITQDSANTRRGVVGFGRDVPNAKTWVWSSHTDQDNVDTALAILDQLEAYWSPDGLLEPGWVTAVRYRLAGRTRRVFGRPRRFAGPPSNLILNGYIPVTHDFQLVDAHSYDDVESSSEIPYASSASGGGFVLPAVMPLSSLPSEGVGSDQITVGGNARAYPIIRFNGPWTNPVLDAGDWVLRWTGEILANDYVEIDTRPWMLTVLSKSGANKVGGLDRRTWLEDMWFAPQSQPQISLGGIATGGDASATIRWRNAWKSY